MCRFILDIAAPGSITCREIEVAEEAQCSSLDWTFKSLRLQVGRGPLDWMSIYGKNIES